VTTSGALRERQRQKGGGDGVRIAVARRFTVVPAPKFVTPLTSAYYARGASRARARAVGALTLFEGRRTFLRS